MWGPDTEVKLDDTLTWNNHMEYINSRSHTTIMMTNDGVWLIGMVAKGSTGDCRKKPVNGTAVGVLGDNGRHERQTTM
ncbi:hypothetical protein J6590_042749 [Homalodisca vitripennis]|nr:hypothetical protein J6590_042749 [Homalodisca vitripennis]